VGREKKKKTPNEQIKDHKSISPIDLLRMLPIETKKESRIQYLFSSSSSSSS
jgi:hypothetical protein